MDFLHDEFSLLFLVFWILWTVWFFVCLSLFFGKSIRHSLYVRSRCRWLIVFSAFGQYLMMTSLTWKIIVKQENWPRMADHWFVWFMIPLHLVPYPVRALRFIIKYHSSLDQNQVPSDLDGAVLNGWQRLNKHEKLISDRAFVWYNWAVMAIFIVIGIVWNVLDSENRPHVTGAEPGTAYWVTCLVLLIIASVCLWTAIGHLCKIRDELRYNTELISIGVAWIIFLGPYIALGWTKAVPNEIESMILLLLCIVSFLISFGMPIHMAKVKPINVDLGNAILDDFDKLMDDQEGSELFYEYMGTRMCTECLDFYRAVKRFQSLCADNNRDAVRAEFESMKRRFIGDTALTPINISDRIVQDINAVDMNGEIPANVFHRADEDNRKTMKTDLYPRFKQWDKAKAYARWLRRQSLQ